MSLVYIVLGFAAGSIPFGVVLARRFGSIDIREHGSGNIGATNVARVLGAGLGAIVLVLDAAKGALPVLLARDACPWIVAATGFAAIVGHCFSPFLGGKGGKGVATALGVFAVIAPWPAVMGIGVFAVTFAITRVVALGSLAGTTAIALILVHRGPTSLAAIGVATAVLLVYTHRGNLSRLVTRSR
ncbi:MAG TPA: glycerol-3-phosphate 1-O-acyltransferase PlsY [Kofleriaceae bacterium]|nr:glycerol-3-phosphate 1-O-acyltransferase PlsY [Kofleriaceae bacterium]